jgi:hypothetical protein
VTTNEGTRAFVMISPWSSPIAEVAASATAIAAHQGQFVSAGRSRRVMITAPTPLTKPTERSISAIRSTKTTPIAIVAMPAVCRSRLTKFRSV